MPKVTRKSKEADYPEVVYIMRNEYGGLLAIHESDLADFEGETVAEYRRVGKLEKVVVVDEDA